MTVVETSSLAELRRRHRGPVIVPEDAGYDAAGITFNGMLDRRPELVTRPLDVDDVVAAISFAAPSGLPIAIRGGGHGVAGRLERLRAVKQRFDPANVLRFNHNIVP